jgi:hypothetical protein
MLTVDWFSPDEVVLKIKNIMVPVRFTLSNFGASSWSFAKQQLRLYGEATKFQ